MPSWKKVVVSGSDATLNSLFVSTAVTASIFSGSHIGNLTGTASYVTGSVHNSSNPALSASYALTASYALNAGGGGGAITIADEGAAQGTATFLNFTGNAVTATVSANTASINIAAAQGTGSVTLHTQASPAVTWSFNHKLNNDYPVLNVWDSNGFAIIPGGILSVDANNLEIYFDIAQAGYASAVVGGTAVSASYSLSSSYALTASYVLGGSGVGGSGTTNRVAKFTAGTTIGDSLIFDDGTNLQITGSAIIVSGSSTSLIVTGSVRSSGGFTGSLFGTSSWAFNSLTASYLNNLNQNLSITGSLTVSGSSGTELIVLGSSQINGGLGITGSFNVTGSTIINTQQNATINIGTSVVATVPTSSMYAAFFDYVARDTSNFRAGTVAAVWNTAGTVQYMDNSTADIGDTSGVTLAVIANGSNAELRATVTTNNWNVKAFVRVI